MPLTEPPRIWYGDVVNSIRISGGFAIMKSCVWLTFAIMGWVHYEMSGGADFVPIERLVASVELEAAEDVARADTTTLMSISSSNTFAQPESSD